MNKRLIAGVALFLCFPIIVNAEEPAKKFEGYSKIVRSDRIINVNADATYTDNVEYEIKVLNKDAIDQINKRSISYSNSMADLEIIKAYTLKSDGKRIDVPKNNFQVETNSGDKGNSPLISDIKTKTIIYPDLGVGDSVVLSYKLIQKEALFPKHFSLSKSYDDKYVVESSDITINAPDSLNLRVESRNIKGGEPVKKDGKTSWTWHFENREIGKPDYVSLVDSYDYASRIVVSNFKDYGELAAAYEERAKPKSAVTERIKKLAEEISKDAKTEHDIAKSLYEWTAKNIHYVGNCIGIGSVVPHDTDHILDNKLGDCKDHTALLQALLAAKNIESTPALVNYGDTYTISDLPDVGVFNHVINYIPSLNLYADSTAQDIPFGYLPMQEEDKPTIHTAKFDGIKKTPASDNSKHWGKSKTELNFAKDGSLKGNIKSEFSGMFSFGARNWFHAIEIDPKLKEEVIKQSLGKSGFNGSGSYVKFDDTNKLTDKFSLEADFKIENAVNLPGPSGVRIAPFIDYHDVSVATFASGAEDEKPSQNFPCLGGSASQEIVMNFPEEINIIASPKDVHIKQKYGSYDAVYTRKGNSITAKREIVDNSPSNVCSPEVSEVFKDFSRAVLKDLKSQIIIEAK